MMSAAGSSMGPTPSLTESPLTTSVWHRPLVPEEAKDRLAKRQANAAVALLRLDRERKVWPLFQHRPDPRAVVISFAGWRASGAGSEPGPGSVGQAAGCLHPQGFDPHSG